MHLSLAVRARLGRCLPLRAGRTRESPPHVGGGRLLCGELVVVPSYPMQLVMPSVVAMAVRNEMAICRIVFQVWLFIVSVWFSG